MTIKEIANQHGISTQAVYQRLKAAGVDLREIKRQNSAELTEEGLVIVKAIFASSDKENVKKKADLKNKFKDLQEQIEKLTAENEELKKDRDGWREQAERLTAVAEAAQKLAADTQEALLRAQSINMASLQAAAAPRGLSFWQRLTGKKSGGVK